MLPQDSKPVSIAEERGMMHLPQFWSTWAIVVGFMAGLAAFAVSYLITQQESNLAHISAGFAWALATGPLAVVFIGSMIDGVRLTHLLQQLPLSNIQGKELRDICDLQVQQLGGKEQPEPSEFRSKYETVVFRWNDNIDRKLRLQILICGCSTVFAALACLLSLTPTKVTGEGPWIAFGPFAVALVACLLMLLHTNLVRRPSWTALAEKWLEEAIRQIPPKLVVLPPPAPPFTPTPPTRAPVFQPDPPQDPIFEEPPG